MISLDKQDEHELLDSKSLRLTIAMVLLVITGVFSRHVITSPNALLMIGLPVLALASDAVNFFQRRALAYYLSDEGLQIQLLTRRRTIAYSDMESVMVVRFKASFSLRSYGGNGYHVGVHPSEHWGEADIACSTYSGDAVALVLKEGRPMLFTPVDPERVADEIRARVRAARLQLRKS